MTGWIYGNSFTNYGLIGTKGKIYAQGSWVTFGEEYNSYNKTNMVRYGNPPNKWTEPKYVSGVWEASNTFFGEDPDEGYVKQVQEFIGDHRYTNDRNDNSDQYDSDK